MTDLSFWITLFTDAGLPSTICQKYAEIFVENRITIKLLQFLDKDLLKEMGITPIGDIIAILQHVKTGNFEAPPEPKLSPAVVTSTTPNCETKPVHKLKLLPGHELPVPEKRRVTREIEGSYKIKLPEGTTEKTRRILTQIKDGSTTKHQTSNHATRIVLLNTSSKPDVIGQPYVDLNDSDDDNEEVEVILSSSSPDVRTANLHKSVPRTIFDRLGAEPQQHKSPQSKSVLAKFVVHSLDSPRKKADTYGCPERVGLKRAASDSVFCRLGTVTEMSQIESQSSRNQMFIPDALEYQGVFKYPRVSDPPRLFSEDKIPRASAKNRLGITARLSGTLASDRTNSRRVHDRLGSLD